MKKSRRRIPLSRQTLSSLRILASRLLQPPVPKPATKPHGCTIDGDEIAGYLGLADRYRSRGNYDRAISDYNIVLGCEPGNRQAQAGLRNAVDAEKYTSQ